MSKTLSEQVEQIKKDAEAKIAALIQSSTADFVSHFEAAAKGYADIPENLRSDIYKGDKLKKALKSLNLIFNEDEDKKPRLKSKDIEAAIFKALETKPLKAVDIQAALDGLLKDQLKEIGQTECSQQTNKLRTMAKAGQLNFDETTKLYSVSKK